jgi:uncharacterized protein
VLTRRTFLLRAAACSPLAALSAGARAELRRVTIGANPAGTNFNVIAGGFAQLIQRRLRIPSIVRPYAGSSVYVPMLQRGEITLGINSGIDGYLALRGEEPYGAPMPNLRALLSIYPLGYMFWTRASSPIRTIADLRGRRVVLNYRSLVPLNRLNRAVLATAGLTESDVDPVTAAGLPEGARLVAEGRADAVAMGYRLPLVLQMHASIAGGLRFLRLGEDEARVPEMMPGAWVDTVAPDATTIGFDAPIRSAMYDTFLITGTHIEHGDAYRLVELLYEAWPELQRDYSLLSGIRKEGLVPSNQSLPYHEGAVAYFRAAGVWSDAHDRRQAELLR